MAITYVTGNAVDALINGEIDVLLHVCNNKGVMGSGIALEIKNRIPDAYNAYKSSQDELCKLYLGGISFGWYDVGKFVCNMVAQDGYGSNRRFLNYGALAECLSKMSKGINVKTVGIPFKMGSDRAGGDWNIVLEMVEYFLKDFNVVIYKLEGV
jgi:O-acetyl-ADP-ribose deacetylase (regulator of RNase III)